ncbi:MAG: sugar phosphate isomerase/epimerase [Methylacidiphilales bacterium]|nr:sugar phosphate isomerase/epimerase [Candidatus Methylacidiphilales bacterium]
MQPFSGMERQFELIRELGFQEADLTDNHDGATLGVEYGFAASVSLDAHPQGIRRMAEAQGLTLTSVCAHANLLDPASPDRYQTSQIIKAIKLAHFLGIHQVITTEGEPKTKFGHRLSREQQLFSISEKLDAPVQWAQELGLELLIEPHGVLTDSVDGMEEILQRLGHDSTVGINLDTGNCWLGGSDPVAFVRRFGSRIRHVHWKDLGQEWETKRGKIFGCGMGTIPLGDGKIPVREVCAALLEIGFKGPTTLEVTGKEAVLESAIRLRQWS